MVKADMGERYKLGLTRNRLFEFDNAVVFCGKRDFQEDGLQRALHLLCIKEPIITSRIVLKDNAEAYVVTDSVEQSVELCNEDIDLLKEKYEKDGVAFYDKAFEFSYTADGFLVIASHTAVCDARALLRLAVDLNEFYNEPLKSVEPSEIRLISEKTDLPLEVASPVVDRLSADLDLKWQRDARIFTVDDFKNAKDAYNKTKSSVSHVTAEISEADMVALKAFCQKQDMDVVGFVGFAFYDALLKNMSGKKKFNKISVQADERLFFTDFENYCIGAYNGASEVSYKKKYSEGAFVSRAKAFQVDCYKNATSTFKVFYDDALLMKTSPSLCDGAYMYKAGLLKSKAARNLAENYGCSCERLCDYFYCNLDQAFWDGLRAYDELYIAEPFKSRSATSLALVMVNGGAQLDFRFRVDKCDKTLAEKIVGTAMGNIADSTKN